MATLVLKFEVDDDDYFLDPADDTGLTNEAYERFTGITTGMPDLSLLGSPIASRLILGDEEVDLGLL